MATHHPVKSGRGCLSLDSSVKNNDKYNSKQTIKYIFIKYSTQYSCNPFPALHPNHDTNKAGSQIAVDFGGYMSSFNSNLCCSILVTFENNLIRWMTQPKFSLEVRLLKPNK